MMELGGAAAAWIKSRIKAWIQPTSRDPATYVVVLRHLDDDDGAAEVRTVDMHGNVIKCVLIRQPVGRLSIHGALLCASHGWGLTCMVDMVTGVVTDMDVDLRKKVNSATPYCVFGHVPSTGEYKVLRIQADYCCRRWRQRCEVMTLMSGGGDDHAGSRWRRRTCPPVTLRIERPWPSSWNVAVVAGLVYFLVDELDMEKDRLAVFDLATEEWKPTTLRGPMTSRLLDITNDKDEYYQPNMRYMMPHERPLALLEWTHFQLAKLGESLVVLYYNVKKNGSTELWFLEDMKDDTTACWTRRYTLPQTVHGDATGCSSTRYTTTPRRCTPLADDESPLYHYPLAVLDDGRILVWVNRTSALRAYDPETCTWTGLATLTGDYVVGMHHGSLQP